VPDVALSSLAPALMIACAGMRGRPNSTSTGRHWVGSPNNEFAAVVLRPQPRSNAAGAGDAN
jgi:hypothetical protein